MFPDIKKYRAGYTGESIVTERNYTRGVWVDTFETVPNKITNTQISNRAVIIGNGPSRLDFDLTLTKHPQGLLGATTLQSYGCNALYRDFTPDFLVVSSNEDMVNEIIDNGYCDEHIVYAHPLTMLGHPNKFYLIPHDPYVDCGVTAAYLACFDGHKTVYLLGFDAQDTPGINWNVYAGTNGYAPVNSQVEDFKTAKDFVDLFKLYDDVDFVRVTHHTGVAVPEAWKYCLNFRQISFRDFILESDL